MKNVFDLINESKEFRQTHLDLSEPCIIRGGSSTNHKGVLAQYLDTNIPYNKHANTKVLLCHACHNGRCSNPKHLYWGTYAENLDDAKIAGARSSRKGIPGSKHTPESKAKISASLLGRPSNNKRGIGFPSHKGRKYKREFKHVWINNGSVQTRIKDSEDLPAGYTFGRLSLID